MPVPEETIQRILDPPRSHQPVLEKVVIRRSPEDFEVEELPLYVPSGSGDHAWLWVEKRGLTTQQVIAAISADIVINVTRRWRTRGGAAATPLAASCCVAHLQSLDEVRLEPLCSEATAGQLPP